MVFIFLAYFTLYNGLQFHPSHFWGKMRTAAREAAFQIALRDCSKAALGKVDI